LKFPHQVSALDCSVIMAGMLWQKQLSEVQKERVFQRLENTWRWLRRYSLSRDRIDFYEDILEHEIMNHMCACRMSAAEGDRRGAFRCLGRIESCVYQLAQLRVSRGVR
jgi:hypothetical protein